MKNHTKIYLKANGYDTTDTILCEVCGMVAVDIHHIERRGMGGCKKKDEPNNLIALCRYCHLRFGDKKKYKDFLKSIKNRVYL